ncbi:MAG TPA: (2Fe-2S)-binding protein [Polyangia bacterium]|nr:(2Fe-2S)-binding protein [Polyangia bacterium]
MPKVIVCRCEDVTLRDIELAIAHGNRDIEEIKRYTGFGTGPCQGKECVWAVARILGQRTGGPVEPFVSRPPLSPTALKYFARALPDDREA